MKNMLNKIVIKQSMKHVFSFSIVKLPHYIIIYAFTFNNSEFLDDVIFYLYQDCSNNQRGAPVLSLINFLKFALFNPPYFPGFKVIKIFVFVSCF